MRPVHTIALAGHRPDRLPADATRHILAGVREIADEYPGVTWLTSGRPGAERIAADELVRRDEHVELVLPFLPTVPGVRHPPGQLLYSIHALIFMRAVHVVSDHYDRNAHRACRQLMVDRADLVLAFWNGDIRGSGTAMTVQMADRRGIPVNWYSMA